MPRLETYLPKDPKSTRALGLGCLALWAFAVLILVGLAGALFILRPDPSEWFAGRVQEPACSGAQLSIGEASFRFESLARAPDGSLPIPADVAGSAYRLEGASSAAVFALSSSNDNLQFAAAVRPGDLARVYEADCSSAVFTVRAVEVLNVLAPAFLSQPGAGLVVFVQADPSGAGIAIRGDLVEAFAAPATPLATGDVAMLPAAEGESTGAEQSPAEAEAPLQAFPTPDCGESRLVLGEVEFAIQPVSAALDGSLPVPDSDGVAYWLEGSETHPVFALSPSAGNLALESTLGAGDQATVAWSNCNSATYSLSAPETGSAAGAEFFDQSLPGITVFVGFGPSSPGFAVRGEVYEEVLSAIEAPAPEPGEVLAEISLLETTLDGETLQVQVSILNFGEEAFTLTQDQVALVPPNAAPVPPVRSRPRLPEGIKPGATKTFTITFPRPAASPAVLRVLGIEYDLEF